MPHVIQHALEVITKLFQGNISLFLLREGLAKCVDWSMKLLSADPESYRAATRQAKADRKRLWKNFEGKTFRYRSPIYIFYRDM